MADRLGNEEDEPGEFSPLVSAEEGDSRTKTKMERNQVSPYNAVEPDYPTSNGQEFHSLERQDFDNNFNTNETDFNRSDTLIRRRKYSSRRRHGDDRYDDWDEDYDGGFLPSMRFQKRSRTKSLKERKKEFSEDNTDGESHRPKTLKERYQEMKEHNEVTVQGLATLVRDSTLKRVKGIGGDSKTWQRFKRRTKDVLQRFSIWFSSFREIEGKFGTATMTFFRFIKWLMFLNLYVSIIMFGVITIPYLVLGPWTYEDSLTDPTASGYDLSINCTKEYEVHINNITATESVAEKILDVLQGTGWMERKILFIGVYHNKTYNSGGNKETYNMSLAYLLAVGASYLITFVLLVKNAAKNMKVTLGMETTLAKYSNKVFAGWDYCIKEPKGAKIKYKSIKTDIVADLLEEKEKKKRLSQTTSQKCKLYTKRFFINMLVFAILVGALWLIAFTADKMLDLLKQDLSDFLQLVVQYVPYLTITVLNLALPIIFEKLAEFENYFNETEIKITLARSILLRLASPVVLIAILYKELIERDEEDEGECGNQKWSEGGGTLRGSVKCWETYVGQQIYKLVLLDLIVETVIVILAQFPRRIVYNRFNHLWLVKTIGPQEFSIPVNVVDIIYTQNLCWLGMFFSPLIPLMTLMKCFLFFYLRKVTLLLNCQPQQRPFRTSRSNSLFMTVLLVSFIIAAVPIGYMIFHIPPSQSCGPFRLYEAKNATMFDTISYTVSNWPDVARDIFYFLGTTAFFVPLFIVLCLLMYYYWVVGSGYKKTEELLKQQLVMEGRDKKFLLARVNEYRLLDTDVLQSRGNDILVGT